MATRMSKARWWVALATAGAAAAAGGVLWFGPALHGGNASEEKKAAAPPTPDVPVTVAAVVSRPVQRRIEVVGTLEGHDEVNISAKVEGRVQSIACDVGDEVRPGQELLRIEETDFLLTVSEMKANLELELAKLRLKRLPGPDERLDVGKVPSVVRARNVEENARSVLDRSRRMGTRVVAIEEMDRAQMDYRVAQSNREQAELDAVTTLAAARSRQAQVDTARQKLRDARVLAPFPSQHRLPPGVKSPDQVRYVVAARKVSEGEMIRSFPASTLMRLVIDQPLKLVATVPERHIAEVRKKQAVAVRVEAYPGQTFPGTVERINPVVERSSRTFTVEVTVPNDSPRLPAGAFAKAAILTRQSSALTVPEEAVVRFAGVVKLFVLDGKKVRAVPVRTGEVVSVAGKDRTERWVEVEAVSGGRLAPGAKVVVSGHLLLADGTAVRVK